MSFERKTKPDGSANPKYVDLLDEDRPLANQKLVSFTIKLSILRKKEFFLNSWIGNLLCYREDSVSKFVGYKYNIDFEKLTNDFQEFIKSERNNLINTMF